MDLNIGEDLDIGLAKFCSFVISNGSGAVYRR